MVTSSSLSLDDNIAFSNPVKYRQVVGSLQYVTLSRPDIAFAVNNVCQYMHAPTENHWFAVKRILRYLHGTVEHGMLIRRSSGSTLQAFTDVLWKGNPDTSLEAFSDADWAGDSDDQRSMGDLLYILALADPVAELTWLQALLDELGIRSSSTPILYYAPAAHGLPECIFPFEDLLGNVMVDILSRLPCKTICRCKCVCNDWRNLINGSYFANIHLSRSSPEGLMIFQLSMVDVSILKWVEIKEELDHRQSLHHDPVNNTLDLLFKQRF
uniref:F-box domain-containing protein n=1 Tax=Tanacetum cinerariifolium TaxID=118510 RepID=A0A699HM47_TANCI|nr:hypothetical protein [Tanacetum cinerariifolium]